MDCVLVMLLSPLLGPVWVVSALLAIPHEGVKPFVLSVLITLLSPFLAILAFLILNFALLKFLSEQVCREIFSA
jgi:hypothetical protein